MKQGGPFFCFQAIAESKFATQYAFLCRDMLKLVRSMHLSLSLSLSHSFTLSACFRDAVTLSLQKKGEK